MFDVPMIALESYDIKHKSKHKLVNMLLRIVEIVSILCCTSLLNCI